MSNKKCRLCGKSKSTDLFFWADKAKTKLGSYCKPCQNQKNREWYARRGFEGTRKAANERARLKIKQHITATKTDKACLDCNVIYPHYVMEYDHVRGQKLHNVSNMVNSHGMESVTKEIAKCELVCSNCHRERTFSRL